MREIGCVGLMFLIALVLAIWAVVVRVELSPDWIINPPRR